MKTEVKKIDRYKRKLSVEVGEEIVAKKFEDIYTRIAKDAQVPGFRKGKAPREVLEKHYKDVANQEVIKELVPQVYEQAVQKEALDVLNCIEIADVKLDNSTISFNAMVEVKPDINFKKDYKDIKINYQNIEVSEEEVKRRLDSLKESRKTDNIDEDLARSLLYPTIDVLKDAIRRQIYFEKEKKQRARIEEEIIDYLMEGAEFEIPVSLVGQHLQELVERRKIDLALRGISKDKIMEEEKNIRQDLEPQAKRQVKLSLILEEIAKRENISLDKDMPQKAMEFLFKNSNWKITEVRNN